MLKLWKLRSRATRSSGAYHIPIISCLSSVLFTWLSYGTTLDSLGALKGQIFAKPYIQTYIHSYTHTVVQAHLSVNVAPANDTPLTFGACIPLPLSSGRPPPSRSAYRHGRSAHGRTQEAGRRAHTGGHRRPAEGTTHTYIYDSSPFSVWLRAFGAQPPSEIFVCP